MGDHRQTVCYSLESLILGQVYTASVSMETIITQWIINTKLFLNTSWAPLLKGPRDPLIDFELPFDRGAKDRPILCFSVNPGAGTWAGCIFYTLEEIRDCGKIAKRAGLRGRDFKKLLARTTANQSIQLADLSINVEHHPNIPWPNHEGFNVGGGNAGFYMLCLPAILPFPRNGRLKLYLPRIAKTVDDPPAYPCPSFAVDPVTFRNICDYFPKAKTLLENAIRSKLWKKADSTHVEGSRNRDDLESRGYEEAMQIGGKEEMGRESACAGKRKREHNGGEFPRKRKINFS